MGHGSISSQVNRIIPKTYSRVMAKYEGNSRIMIGKKALKISAERAAQ